MTTYSRAVIFDFDGTIIDSNHAKEKAFIAVLTSVGVSESEANTVRAASLSLDRFAFFDRFYRDFKTRLPAEVSAPRLAGKFSALCHQEILQCKMIPGIQSFLEELQQNDIRLYVSSATPEKSLVPLLMELNITRYFSGVYGGPSKKLTHIRKVQRDNHCEPSDITYFGDSDDDFEAAMQAGCNFVGVVIDVGRFSVTPNIRIANFLDKRLSGVSRQT